MSPKKKEGDGRRSMRSSPDSWLPGNRRVWEPAKKGSKNDDGSRVYSLANPRVVAGERSGQTRGRSWAVSSDQPELVGLINRVGCSDGPALGVEENKGAQVGLPAGREDMQGGFVLGQVDKRDGPRFGLSLGRSGMET
ncbi:unnamed protein product [Linum trigynum]|uniref:Uncharacterized protein n=1 Tax=Linum trigynum TaxID=586398 RepID=A0AAV2CST4_9ROSI